MHLHMPSIFLKRGLNMKALNKRAMKKFYLLLVPILILGFALAAYAETENEYEVNDTDEPFAVFSEESNDEYSNELLNKVETAQNFETYENLLLKKNASRIMEVTTLPEEAALSLVKYSEDLDIRISLLLALMELESDFNKYEVGTHEDRGYMQIIPGTEKWLAEEYGDTIGVEYDPERIFEEDYNIGLSAVYINMLHKAYGDNYNRILSEYNRGPYNLKAYYEKYGTYSTSYSRKVLSLEKKYKPLNS